MTRVTVPRMPLHPAAKQMVDQMASVDAPKVWEVEITDLRAGEMTFASIGAGEPVDVEAVADQAIPGPHGDIPVRVYAPEPDGVGDPLPVVVYLHGGGWVSMSIRTHDLICRRLARAAGALVVSVEYRLAPEHPYPVPLDDAYAAVAWVAEHAAGLGGDPDRVAVMGDSAGGNLAAAVALRARESGGPALRAQVLVYPALDPSCASASHRENGEGYVLDEPSLRWFWAQYLGRDGNEKDALAAPACADDLHGLPPATIVTAEFDPLRDEGEEYGARLRDAGVPVTVRRFDGMIHGFLGMPAMFDEADAAMDVAASALRDAFSTP